MVGRLLEDFCGFSSALPSFSALFDSSYNFRHLILGVEQEYRHLQVVVVLGSGVYFKHDLLFYFDVPNIRLAEESRKVTTTVVRRWLPPPATANHHNKWLCAFICLCFSVGLFM